MANKEVADLTPADPLTGGEALHVVQSGNSRETTAGAVSRSGLGAVNADIIPDTDSARDLGDVTKPWALAHIDEVRATNFANPGGSKSVGADYVVDGVAKSWCKFSMNGSHSITESMNVSSITDISLGNARLTHSVSFSSTDSSIPVGSAANTISNPSDQIVSCVADAASSTVYEVFDSGTTHREYDLNHAIVHGELA